MTMAVPSSLLFTVKRSEPELIPPANPTPYEFKYLSDMDDQKGHRKQTPIIQFYRSSEQKQGRDPVKVIKKAIAEALVYYYPFAGRLREGCDGKLMVECTGEGVLFIEATAHVRLDQFGDVLLPPFPGADDLHYDVKGSSGILDCPLLLIQVTRLMCGGFIFALRLNHTMSDAAGLVQFMTAAGEIARGAVLPSVQPVWDRELLNARDPPQVSFAHHVYDEIPHTTGTPLDDMTKLVNRSFFFSLAEIAGLKKNVPLPPQLQTCSKVDLLTAALWQCRTFALNLDSNEEVGVVNFINGRTKLNPPLPVGFYGNVLVLPVALSTSGELCRSSLSYAVELVVRAKATVTDEFIRSSIDLLVKKGRRSFREEQTYYVSDLTRMGFEEVDFGWGRAVYGGPAASGVGPPGTFLMLSRNGEGEDGVVGTVNLPGDVMGRFAVEIGNMIRACNMKPKSSCIRSPL